MVCYKRLRLMQFAIVPISTAKDDPLYAGLGLHVERNRVPGFVFGLFVVETFQTESVRRVSA